MIDGAADKQSRQVASALRRLELLKKRDAFDPINPESVPTEKQLEVMKEFGKIKQQWIRAGNQSGKSATCARILSWVLMNSHPFWKRPAEWSEEPLLIIVAGRTGKQIEDSLLPKIRSYLEPGTYKEVRIGNIIQRLEMENGDRVIFQSLENPTTARERLQSYVAHLVWVDELPPTMDIVRELLIRVQARNGYFLASFTPTIISADIQKYVDALIEPEGRVYRFNMLDNPLYSDPVRKAELIARYHHLPEHVRKAIFEGEWMSSEDQVYYFDYKTMVEMPEGYSRLWRHIESVDPATESKLGLTIWAENPRTHVWYCILAEYVSGIYVPTEIIKAVQEKTRDFNIVRRVADSEATWYINQAGSMGISYMAVYKKSGRKHELIKNLQQFLDTRGRISPTCPDLVSELQECRWSDRSEGKIVNASKYHLLDTAQYFVDIVPKPETQIISSSWDEWIYKANDQRKQAEEKKRLNLDKKKVRILRRRL